MILYMEKFKGISKISLPYFHNAVSICQIKWISLKFKASVIQKICQESEKIVQIIGENVSNYMPE